MSERNKRRHPDWAEQERSGDYAWISENLHVLWPAAEKAYVAAGRGIIVVDITVQILGVHPFFYLAEEKAAREIGADTAKMRREYDPDWEVVIVLLKERNRSSTYRVGLPSQKPNG